MIDIVINSIKALFASKNLRALVYVTANHILQESSTEICSKPPSETKLKISSGMGKKVQYLIGYVSSNLTQVRS